MAHINKCAWQHILVTIIKCTVLWKLSSARDFFCLFACQFRNKFLLNWVLPYLSYLLISRYSHDHDFGPDLLLPTYFPDMALCTQMHLPDFLIMNLKILCDYLWSSPSNDQNVFHGLSLSWEWNINIFCLAWKPGPLRTVVILGHSQIFRFLINV